MSDELIDPDELLAGMLVKGRINTNDEFPKEIYLRADDDGGYEFTTKEDGDRYVHETELITADAALAHLWGWLPIRHRKDYLIDYPAQKEIIRKARAGE